MKKKSAWLIRWEGPDYTLRGRAPFLAFVDARKSTSTIRDMATAIYLASNSLTPAEKLHYATNNEGKRALVRQDHASITVGFKPWVVARQVEDIEIRELEGKDVISWKQPVFEMKEGYFRRAHSVEMEEIVVRA